MLKVFSHFWLTQEQKLFQILMD